MRKLGIVLGLIGTLVWVAPALATVFVIGPGMLGNPGADDPSVGYSSLALDQELTYPDAAFAPGGSGAPLQPWEEEWYQMSQKPGI